MIFTSYNPADGTPVWTGPSADAGAVDAAVRRARSAFRSWSRVPLAERETLLRRFAQVLEGRREELADAISLEVGKPAWEAALEVQSMITKVDFALAGRDQRAKDFGSGPVMTRFKPHGVCAVFGPFNFPGHLPNGHIVPALLAGNTVVFKPSEYTPLVAARTVAAWHEAGLPEGVLELVQGGRTTGEALAAHADLNGLFFTGSFRTGQALAALSSAYPQRILALELGGNNPLVVWQVKNLPAAALMVVQSAYATAGQRCTCARRLILSDDAAGESLLRETMALLRRVRVGPPSDRPEPFMGPVISRQAADRVLEAQSALQARGAVPLVPCQRLAAGSALLSPGIIDVTPMSPAPPDEEIFGPLLQVLRVSSFAGAITAANATRFGLAAGLLSDDPALYSKFRDEVRAGVINWNQPLTGASGAAPFGGIGQSGNHRPSGLFAADYCAYPVASLERDQLQPSPQSPPGIAP